MTSDVGAPTPEQYALAMRAAWELARVLMTLPLDEMATLQQVTAVRVKVDDPERYAAFGAKIEEDATLTTRLLEARNAIVKEIPELKDLRRRWPEPMANRRRILTS